MSTFFSHFAVIRVIIRFSGIRPEIPTQPTQPYIVLAELHVDLFSRHASPLEVYVLCRSTKEVNMLCPTRLVVDATENSKEGGVAAEVGSSQTSF